MNVAFYDMDCRAKLDHFTLMGSWFFQSGANVIFVKIVTRVSASSLLGKKEPRVI